MKKIFAFLLTCICLFADRAESINASVPKSKLRFSGEVNLGIDYYHYKEPSVMDISGPMLSMEGNFSLGYKLFKFQFDGFFSTHLGANFYEGGLFNTATNQTIAYSTDSKDWYLGVASRFGVAFSLSGREVAFIYSGIGYRYLHNMMIDKPWVKASYERDQGYVYFLVGVDGEMPITRFFSMIGELQYRQLIYGYQVSGMSALGYDNDFCFVQTNGFGGRVGLGGKFYFANQMALKAKLYLDYWAIEDSSLVAGYQGGKFVNNFVEPRNLTRVVGVSLGLVF